MLSCLKKSQIIIQFWYHDKSNTQDNYIFYDYYELLIEALSRVIVGSHISSRQVM